MSTSCSLEPVNVALFGKEGFVDGLTDLEMGAYCIIQLELKSNNKRDTEEGSQLSSHSSPHQPMEHSWEAF